jgi:hypothetical protein
VKCCLDDFQFSLKHLNPKFFFLRCVLRFIDSRWKCHWPKRACPKARHKSIDMRSHCGGSACRVIVSLTKCRFLFWCVLLAWPGSRALCPMLSPFHPGPSWMLGLVPVSVSLSLQCPSLGPDELRCHPSLGCRLVPDCLVCASPVRVGVRGTVSWPPPPPPPLPESSTQFPSAFLSASSIFVPESAFSVVDSMLSVFT